MVRLGSGGDTRSDDLWIIDPEALLLFSTHIARHDSRLFDENSRLAPHQRFRPQNSVSGFFPPSLFSRSQIRSSSSPVWSAAALNFGA